jgi:hypothetical protein
MRENVTIKFLKVAQYHLKHEKKHGPSPKPHPSRATNFPLSKIYACTHKSVDGPQLKTYPDSHPKSTSSCINEKGNPFSP